MATMKSFTLLSCLLLLAAPALAQEFLKFCFLSNNFPNHYIGIHSDGLPRIVTTQEQFRIVSPGLQGTPGTISFESVRFPGRYLRHRNWLLHLDTFNEGNYELFKKDATFWPRESKFFSEFTAYESFNYPNYFIRHQSYRLKISTEAVFSTLLKKDASFKPLSGLDDGKSDPKTFVSKNFPAYSIGLTNAGLPSIVSSSDENFRIVSPGLTGEKDSVSFESEKFPGHYLRHRNFLVYLNQFEENAVYFKDATFFMRENRFFNGYAAFESSNFPSRFIRHQNYRLKLHPSDSSTLFKNDASFSGKSTNDVIIRAGPYCFRSKNFPGHTMGLDSSGIPRIIQLCEDRFYLVIPGLTGQLGTVSFASERFPGHYLRHRSYLLHLDPFEEKSVYYPDATFFLREDKYFPGYHAFESTNFPNYFIRHQGYRLKISAEDGTNLMHLDSSFKTQ